MKSAEQGPTRKSRQRRTQRIHPHIPGPANLHNAQGHYRRHPQPAFPRRGCCCRSSSAAQCFDREEIAANDGKPAQQHAQRTQGTKRCAKDPRPEVQHYIVQGRMVVMDNAIPQLVQRKLTDPVGKRLVEPQASSGQAVAGADKHPPRRWPSGVTTPPPACRVAQGQLAFELQPPLWHSLLPASWYRHLMHGSISIGTDAARPARSTLYRPGERAPWP